MNAESGADNAQPKRYQSISEVADILGVNASLIRYWEKHFTLVAPKKNRKGHRLFTSQDIEALKFIHFLVKEKGQSIENARHTIRNRHQVANQEYQMAETLRKTRTFLTEIKMYMENSNDDSTGSQ